MSADPVQPVAVAAGQLITGGGGLRGICIRETTGGAPATVRLFDNTSGAGVLLGTYALSAGASWDGGDYSGVRRFAVGVFAVITGTVEGSIFI